MHRHSLLLSRPLSVCLKLKDFVDKIEPKHLRHSAPHAYLPITDHLPVLQKHNQTQPLQEDYNARELAEAPTDPLLISEHRYPHVRALRTDSSIGDGLWLCCHCHHENILIHYRGLFPFKHLTCARCNLILCSSCQTSEILSPLPYGMIHASHPSQDREVRYLHVCTACGLSHRAEMAGHTLDFYGVVCKGCRTSSYGEWPRWHVGSPEPYRRDPDASYVRLVEMRVGRAAILVGRAEDRRVERLRCKNPD